MTVAKLIKGTLLVSWSNGTRHGPYDPGVLQFLGIDTSLSMSWVRTHFPYLTPKNATFPEIHLDSIKLPCNSLITTKIHSCPAVHVHESAPDKAYSKYFCTATYTKRKCDIRDCEFYDFYSSNLHEMRKINIREKCLAAGLGHQKSKDNTITIVVHVRQGDICLHCHDGEYYTRLHKSISTAVKGLGKDIRYIIEAEKDFQHPPNLPNAIIHRGGDVKNAVCSFVTSDILVTSGSSFPYVALFAQPFKPIVFEEIYKNVERFKNHHLVRKYVWPDGESIHLNHGQLVAPIEATQVLLAQHFA